MHAPAHLAARAACRFVGCLGIGLAMLLAAMAQAAADDAAPRATGTSQEAGPAQGPPLSSLQWDATLEWLNDERYRGVSLSERRPVWRAELNVDHDSGLYAGTLLSADTGARTRWSRARIYGGLARPFARQPELSWDVGMVYHRFLRDEMYDDNYVEPYAGLHGMDWQARFGYAPRYYGFKVGAAYLSGDKTWAPVDGWTVAGHAGLIHMQGAIVRPSQRVRLDGRLSLQTMRAGIRFSVGVDAAAVGTRGETAALVSASHRF